MYGTKQQGDVRLRTLLDQNRRSNSNSSNINTPQLKLSNGQTPTKSLLFSTQRKGSTKVYGTHDATHKKSELRFSA